MGVFVATPLPHMLAKLDRRRQNEHRERRIV
jgi:hypothetical protein